MIVDNQEQKDILLQVLAATQFTIPGAGIEEFAVKYKDIVGAVKMAEVAESKDDEQPSTE